MKEFKIFEEETSGSELSILVDRNGIEMLSVHEGVAHAWDLSSEEAAQTIAALQYGLDILQANA